MKSFVLLSATLVLNLSLSCGPKQEQPSPLSPGTSVNPDSVTYDRHVRPLIENHCGPCHIAIVSGGVRLNSYDNVKVRIDRIILLTETGAMPKGGPRLSTEQIDTLKAWKLGNEKP